MFAAVAVSLLAAPTLRANLVQNENFQDGLANWTITGDVTASSSLGTSAAKLVATSAAGAELAQSLALDAGSTYGITFSAAGGDGQLFVYLAGTELNGGNAVPLTASLNQYSYLLTANSPLTSQELAFSWVAADGGAAYVTGVNVVDPPPISPIPEPSTIFAAVLLLAPLGVTTLRMVRQARMA